jgi:hypothetical protein
MRRQLLHRLPIFAAAGGIAFLFLVTLWNYAVERDHPKWRLRSAHPLDGVAKEEPVPISWSAALSGDTQKAFSTSLGRRLPVFPFAVRVKNQLLFSLFGVSGAPSVVVGRKGHLYERFYIDEYCRRGVGPDAEALAQWSSRIVESADAAREMGKGFVYLISPSKASQYPQLFPKKTRCPAQEAGTTDKLAPYRAALLERGLAYVDGPALIDEAKKDYRIDLFPRGGTHWNLLGAGLATREVSRLLARQRAPLASYDFDWREAGEATGADRDLLDLLNLLWPNPHYPVAALTAKETEARCERAPRLLALGGSFLREIVVDLAQAPCPPDVDHWFSVRLSDDSFDLLRLHSAPGDAGDGQRLEASPALLRESIEKADVILLEENEATIRSLVQVDRLWRALRPPTAQKLAR